MTLKLILDRYEENIGVCLDFDDNKYYISKEILGELKVNDIFNIEFDGENFSNIIFLPEETNEKKEAISQRENFSLLCKSGCESSGYLKNHLHSCLTFNGSFTITLGLLVTLLFSLSCTSLSSALAYPHPPSSSPLSYNSPFLSFCLPLAFIHFFFLVLFRPSMN